MKLDALFGDVVIPDAVSVVEKEITMIDDNAVEPRIKNVDLNDTRIVEIKWFLIREKPRTCRNSLQSLLWVAILS
jgi:hypothetical protein